MLNLVVAQFDVGGDALLGVFQRASNPESARDIDRKRQQGHNRIFADYFAAPALYCFKL